MKQAAKSKLSKNAKWRRPLIIGLIAASIIATVAIVTLRNGYNSNLRPVSSDATVKFVTIPTGSSVGVIADVLKDKELIRSDWAFEWFIRTNELIGQLKAGTYALNQGMSTNQIVRILYEGKVATDLVTILPAKSLAQTKQGLIDSGFSQKEVELALNPANYAGHSALSDKPPLATLEGYLYPESFQKTSQTTAKEIIQLSLDEMALRLTPSVRSGIAARGLSVHRGIILASIVEQDAGKPEDRAKVAQVFYKRLSLGMRLESDPTIKFGDDYNTYKISGLPPGPISNVSESSLEAVANPASTDWLYFVAGDDGTTHFSKTLSDHERLTAEHCTKLCQ